MAPVSSFRYQRLRHPGHNIRLLTLSPSPLLSKPIQCHLREVDLDDAKGSYEALSYTWGFRGGTVPISCNGQMLLITANCASALRYLRNRLTDRVLWVDAVCINQGCIEEKSFQVPLMGDIYGSASQVVIWLGEGVPGDEVLLRRARIGGHLCYVRGVTHEGLFSPTTRKLVSKVMADNEMDVIRRIGGNAWFKRLWTIQELLLASSAVFQIGHTQCSTVSLYTYFIIAEALAQTNLAELSLFCIRSQVLEVLQPPSTKFKALYVNLWAAKRSAKDGHEEILAMILKLACLCEAADPRDRAYGMYGLLRALASNVADASLFYVNYTKPLAEIYEDTARALVCMSKSLWPLEIISRMPETETVSTSDLPSWVPDLRNPSAIDIDWKPTLFRNVKSDRKLNIPARSTLRQKLREWIKMILGLAFEEKPEMVLPDTKASGRLQISVRYLAEVTEVYGRMPSPGKDSPDGDALRTACLSEWAAVVLAGQDEYLESGDGLAALESLTPALNHIRQRHTPVEVEDPPPGSSRGGSCRRQDQPIGAYDGAALFRTACGLLGLCKGDVRPGNRVWQAVGGRYPFVLRRELVPPWRSVLSSWSVWPRERVYSLVGIADVCGLDAQAREVAARWQKDLIKVHFHDVTLV